MHMEKYKFIRQEPIDNIFSRVIYHVYDTGSCQCSKDCNCIDNKDKFLGEVIKYTHIKAEQRGKYKRTYISLEGATQSYNSQSNDK